MSEQETSANQAGQTGLHLLAFEEEDLAALSANLQDAIVRIADMTFLPQERRFALICQRFDWVAAEKGRIERCQTGLHFDAVRKASVQGFDQTRRDRVLNLLSITFEGTEAPAGTILLTFSAGGAVRLEVDYIEAQMSDLDLRWKARRRPGHQLDEDNSG
jgi:hypothetical protein